MVELLKTIEVLIEDNEFISKYIDENIELVKSTDMESMDVATADFYKFLNGYTDRNTKFKTLMAEFNYQSVWDIKPGGDYTEEKLSALLKKFDNSVRTSQKKLSLYGQLISGELNMINKIKHFKTSGKIDFKI